MKPWMRWLLWIALIGGAIFGVFRYFFIDFHRVPDTPTDPLAYANSPNLEPGDLVLVWRGKPHLGDLVRCPDPSAPPEAPRWLVARVIGIGGDKLDSTDGNFRINGFRLNTGSCQGNPRKVIDESGAEVDLACFSEELGGGKHDVQAKPDVPLIMNETVVQPGKLFLLSDNRSAPWAHDSRDPEVGQIDADRCEQRLLIRIISKKGWGDGERRMTFLN